MNERAFNIFDISSVGNNVELRGIMLQNKLDADLYALPEGTVSFVKIFYRTTIEETKMPFNRRGWGIPASALSRYCQMEIEVRVRLFWQAAISITHKLQKPALSRADVFLRQLVCTLILSKRLRACFFLITFKDQ